MQEAIDNTENSHYLTDQVDSVKFVTDSNGFVKSRFEYYPYGELWINEQDDPDNAFKPKFNSQVYDEESGFYFFNARYYDAEIGRFVTTDSSIDGPGNAHGWNRYAYCHGNPVIYKDPSGHYIWPTFSIGGDGISIGFSTVAGVGAGLNFSWGNGGSVGVYASAGPEFLCFGASARVGVNYGFKSKEVTGFVSASFGFRCGASVNASASYNLTRGEFAGASVGVGFQSDGGANAGLSLNFNKNGYAGFSAGIGYTHTTANGSKIGGTVGGSFDGGGWRFEWGVNGSYISDKTYRENLIYQGEKFMGKSLKNGMLLAVNDDIPSKYIFTFSAVTGFIGKAAEMASDLPKGFGQSIGRISGVAVVLMEGYNTDFASAASIANLGLNAGIVGFSFYFPPAAFLGASKYMIETWYSDYTAEKALRILTINEQRQVQDQKMWDAYVKPYLGPPNGPAY